MGTCHSQLPVFLQQATGHARRKALLKKHARRKALLKKHARRKALLEKYLNNSINYKILKLGM